MGAVLFRRNFLVADVTRKSLTRYEDVVRVRRVIGRLYEDVSDFQTISTCPDGLACRYTCPQQVVRVVPVEFGKRHDMMDK